MKQNLADGGLRLKEARKKLGLSQKERAEKLEVSAAYLSLIETGRQPLSVPIAEKLYRLYGTDFEWLYYGKHAETSAGGRLKAIRKQLGLTQKELAEKLDISSAYIGFMETGHMEISRPTIEKMEMLFGVRRQWLIYGKGKPLKQ